MRHHKRYGGVKRDGGRPMQAKAIATRAEGYTRLEGAGIAGGLLATLIDLFTVQGDTVPPQPDEVRAAWERLTRRLDARATLREQRLLNDGIATLAAALLEAGDEAGAAIAREIFPPVPRAALEPLETEPVPAFSPESPLWTPHPAL
jgi:hypothetical protein